MVASSFSVFAPACEFGEAVVDLADLRTGLLRLHDDVVVVAGYDVDDELLAVGVVVGPGEGVAEQLLELRGEVRGVRRLQSLRRAAAASFDEPSWDALALGSRIAAAPSATTLPAANAALRFGIRL